MEPKQPRPGLDWELPDGYEISETAKKSMKNMKIAENTKNGAKIL